MQIGIGRFGQRGRAVVWVLSSVGLGVSCMSAYVSGASKAKERAKASSKRAIPQHLIGGVAFAIVAVACGWTAYASLFTGKVEPLRFSDRFDAVLSAGASVAVRSDITHSLPVRTRSLAQEQTDPEVRRNYQTLMNGAQTLGAQPAAFSTAELPKFERRLIAYAPQSAAAVRVVQSVPLPARRPQIRDIAQTTASKPANVAAATPAEKPFSIFEKLFGKNDSHGPVLAYAAPDGGVMSDGSSISYGGGRYDRTTAVYDISAKTVYMPDGKKLEAHSGLGDKMDDPRFVHVRMRGATPATHLRSRDARAAVSRRRGDPPQAGWRRGRDPRPDRPAGAHLHARSERRLQRLRLVQGLQRIPERLQERRGQEAGRRRQDRLSRFGIAAGAKASAAFSFQPFCFSLIPPGVAARRAGNFCVCLPRGTPIG